MTVPEAGWFVVANGNAGAAERAAVDTALGVLAQHGPARVVHTDDLAHLEEALSRVEGHVLVVAGGDGSLHCVIERLWRAGRLGEAVIALVPLGTGNDLARGLDLPLQPAAAAERIVAGSRRGLDLLVDDEGGVVVNAVHAGLGADAAQRAAAMKDSLGPAAYPAGAVLAAARTDGWDLEVHLDGRRLELPGDRVLMVAVANGPSVGGGTAVAPDARPDDGVLDVMVSTAVGAAARVAFGAALRTGAHVDRDDVVLARGREVRIAGEPVGHNADGEVSDGVTDRTYRLEPRAWTLLG